MQSARLYHQSFTCDGHVDTFRNLVKGGGCFLRGEGGWEVDLPRMREAGLNLQIAAIYTSLEEVGPTSSLLALKVLECIRRTVEGSLGQLRLMERRRDLIQLELDRAHGLLVCLEGSDPLLQDLDLLEVFYRLGLRGVGLTHNHNSPSAGGCGASPVAGLSDFGRELLRRMSSLGMFLDTAHLGRKAFDEVLQHYRGPLINSHSCCQKLVPGERNLDDAQLRAIAASGGLAAVTFVPKFLVTEGRCTSRDVFRHLEHMVEVAGIDHVAIGSDFDGTEHLPDDLKDPRDLPHLVAHMLEAGWGADSVARVVGGNWLRVLSSLLPT